MKQFLYSMKHKLLFLAVAITLCGGMTHGLQGSAAADVMQLLAAAETQQSAPLKAAAIVGEQPVSTPVFQDRNLFRTLRITAERLRNTSREKDIVSVDPATPFSGMYLFAGFGILAIVIFALHTGSHSRAVIIEYIHSQDGLK